MSSRFSGLHLSAYLVNFERIGYVIFIINFSSSIYWTCKIQNVTPAAVLVGLHGDCILSVRIILEEELSLCDTNDSD